jgi:voltage-gated sodium channel
MLKKLLINEKFILGIILLNTCVLFISGFVNNKDFSKTLTIVDHVITLIFLLEMVYKIYEFGAKGYFKSAWNVFDFVLVLISIPALISFAFNIGIEDLSFVLVFRILRVFKTFRFFRFIPDTKKLFAGIARTLRASIFVVLGFAIYTLIIGLLSYYMFKNNPSEYFSNPLISLYSIFKIFTVEGWFEIPEKLSISFTTTKTVLTYMYFSFVVLSGGIFGLSLVNSIFVDTMVSDNNDKLESKVDKIDEKLNKLISKSDKDET